MVGMYNLVNTLKLILLFAFPPALYMSIVSMKQGLDPQYLIVQNNYRSKTLAQSLSKTLPFLTKFAYSIMPSAALRNTYTPQN
jgi:hypothetical protein